MSTKMKGLLKGLRYISHIFEEEKEIHIGFPTDVKHVAHIGWDGPSSVDSSQPSWMKKFTSPTTSFPSSPLRPLGDSREDSEIKWVSEDSKRANRAPNSPVSNLPDLPKSSRRHSNKNLTDSPRKKDKSRQSRISKDPSYSTVKSTRFQQESSQGTSSPSLLDIPKKSRMKKSNGERSSRTKGGPSNDTYIPSFSDPGPNRGSRLSHVPSIYDKRERLE